MAEAKVIISEAAVQAFIRNPDGPVGRRLMVVAEAVKTATIGSLKEGFPKDFLGPTIVKRMVMTDEGPNVQVGSDHTRTQPHIIRGNPLLVFHWAKVGRVVYFRKVNHPGSNFDNYLITKLVAALEQVRGA